MKKEILSNVFCDNGKKAERYFLENDKYNLIVDIYPVWNDRKNKHCLMARWVKNWGVPKFIENTFHVDTYATEKETGVCYGIFNPTVKVGGAGFVINFDYVLEDTEENRIKVVQAASEMFEKNIKVLA